MSGAISYVRGKNTPENVEPPRQSRRTSAERQKLQGLKMPPAGRGTNKSAIDLASSPQKINAYGTAASVKIENVRDGFDETISEDFDATRSTSDTFTGIPTGQGQGNGDEYISDDGKGYMGHYDVHNPQHPNEYPAINDFNRLGGVPSRDTGRFGQVGAVQDQHLQGLQRGNIIEDDQTVFHHPNQPFWNNQPRNYVGRNQQQDDESTQSGDDFSQGEYTGAAAHIAVEQRIGNIAKQVNGKRKQQHQPEGKPGRYSQVENGEQPEDAAIHKPAFSDDQLKTMSYAEVEKKTPWDALSEKKSYRVPEYLEDKTPTEIIEYFVNQRKQERTEAGELDVDAQTAYYKSLTTKEWNEAGDYLFSKLGEIFNNLIDARMQKRRTMEKYERALEAREAKVRSELVNLDQKLDVMRSDGEGLIRGRA